MDIFFTEKKWYVFEETPEEIRGRIGQLREEGFFESSWNLSGGFTEGDRFTIRKMNDFFNPDPLKNSSACINGFLKADKRGGTRLEITVRPNYTYVILVYTSLFICLISLSGIQLLQGPVLLSACLSLFFVLLALGIIWFVKNSLKRRFERLIGFAG